jgi:hypothetical protein
MDIIKTCDMLIKAGEKIDAGAMGEQLGTSLGRLVSVKRREIDDTKDWNEHLNKYESIFERAMDLRTLNIKAVVEKGKSLAKQYAPNLTDEEIDKNIYQSKCTAAVDVLLWHHYIEKEKKEGK